MHCLKILRENYRYHQLSVFVITYIGFCHQGKFWVSAVSSPQIMSLLTFSYMLNHAQRKSLSGVKHTIIENWMVNESHHHPHNPFNIANRTSLLPSIDIAENYLGSLDAIFMMCYAIGLYFNGWLGDRCDSHVLASISLMGSGVSLILFGCLTEWLLFYNVYFYVAMYVMFGLFQSIALPNYTQIVANWTPDHQRGLVFGIWSSCQSAGNVLAGVIASMTLKTGYENVFLVSSALMISFSIVTMFGIRAYPPDMESGYGYEVLDEPNGNDDNPEQPSSSIISSPNNNNNVISTDEVLATADGERRNSNSSVKSESSLKSQSSIKSQSSFRSHSSDRSLRTAVGFCQAIRLPFVIVYSISVLCLKLVNYAFFFWLPFYLREQYGWTETAADEISMGYDIGAVIGGMIAGVVTDRIGCRSPVLFLLLLCSLPLMFGYSICNCSKLVNAIVSVFVGSTIGGPYNLMTSAIAADLGRQPEIAGNVDAISTVTGIIDGTGSMGSALGQLLIPELAMKLSWNGVFYFFIGLNAISALCLIRLVAKDVRRLYRQYRRRAGDAEAQPLMH